ncbi:DNA modification methylase [Ornatilinea apprima]|uniref:site-specific DNA-methyltransferase (cytosine-N(4)-specific) n=2 Tax=Ornatilinea apprima TaxID=1134406 RepID=A0A0P6XKH8_9CHLR|nr:DNA modification methylase [Ornatilinea apprima]
MFPLEFPLEILGTMAHRGDTVLDPFCGRGTTNFAARLLGLDSLGVDSSPVAVAISAAKLVTVSPEDILAEARVIINTQYTFSIPEGDFWNWAYHSDVLRALCHFRAAFLNNCTSPARIALRGIILGALHGPKQKTFPSYFSNQCPRTYAPKPAYSIRFWKERGLYPEPIDVMGVIERRAKRYYKPLPGVSGYVKLADSRNRGSLEPLEKGSLFRWVITSPPYYGMRTYIPDQWLRNWFVGGPDIVDYTNENQLAHSGAEKFSDDLKKVWKNTSLVCANDATMVIRFGGISDRRTSPIDLITKSIQNSGWKITKIVNAGSASEGKRQANAFLRTVTEPLTEYDIWTSRDL